MEAINRQKTNIDSNLDSAQQINNDEANLSITIEDNSRHSVGNNENEVDENSTENTPFKIAAAESVRQFERMKMNPYDDDDDDDEDEDEDDTSRNCESINKDPQQYCNAAPVDRADVPTTAKEDFLKIQGLQQRPTFNYIEAEEEEEVDEENDEEDGEIDIGSVTSKRTENQLLDSGNEEEDNERSVSAEREIREVSPNLAEHDSATVSEQSTQNELKQKDVVTISDEETALSTLELSSLTKTNEADSKHSLHEEDNQTNDVINLDEDSRSHDDYENVESKEPEEHKANEIVEIRNLDEETRADFMEHKKEQTKERLLYKFEIDDSSSREPEMETEAEREHNNIAPVKIDLDEQPSEDTFASLNGGESKENSRESTNFKENVDSEDGQIANSHKSFNLPAQEAMSVDSPPHDATEQDSRQSLTPKLNGDHMVRNEDEIQSNESAVGAPEDLPNPDDEFYKPTQPVYQFELDDDASRCSSLNSSESCSTATSSTNQLVIDHPMAMEDMNPAAVVECANKMLLNSSESDMDASPVKMSLKRKLSHSSDVDESLPQPKQPHLEVEECHPEGHSIVRNEDENSMTQENHFAEPDLIKGQSPAQQEKLTVDKEISFKSLILQQLNKSQPLPPAPAADAAALMPQPPVPPSPAAADFTKYLCFKCKTGSFDSFAALAEHQNECLASMSFLFSFNAPVDLPPPPPPAPAHADAAIKPLPAAQKKRYYKCSSCGSYHENWNLFMHISEQHNKHICLYCVRLFPTAEKLSLHLEIKHDLEQNHFNSEEALRKVTTHSNETRLLMCCTCEHVFLEDDPFSDHICTEYMKACTLCGQRGRHTNQCKSHPDAKRRSTKVKKKTKEKPADMPPTVPTTISRSSSLLLGVDESRAEKRPHSSLQHRTATPTTSTPSHCDNKGQGHHAHSAHSSVPTALHTEDSNSNGSNMVIDESCTTEHGTSLVNPFKELDERERLEREANMHSDAVLPPGRSPALATPTMESLIVPKLRLRVPKEFQKSVDAAISSSESDEDEDDEELEVEEEGEGEASNLTSNAEDMQKTMEDDAMSTSPQFDREPNDTAAIEKQLPSQEDSAENSKENIPSEEDSLDDANSNLERILQEIERTKMDIQRTKETLHASKSPASSRTAERNWTPTPPTSPNSHYPINVPQSQESQQPAEMEDEHKPEDHETEPKQLQEEDAAVIGGNTDMDMDVDFDKDRDLEPQMENSIENAMPPSDEISSDKPVDTTVDSPKLIDVENCSAESNEQKLPDPPMDTEDQVGLTAAPVDFASGEHSSEAMSSTEDAHNSEQPKADEQAQYIEAPVLDGGASTHKDAEMDEADDVNETERPDNADDVDVCDKSGEENAVPVPPADGIEVANEDTHTLDLQLDRPLEKFEFVEFLRICLQAIYPFCLYCNHARRIAVNGRSLALHMIAQHRFTATVDSITAEELKADTIVSKLKSALSTLEEHYFNTSSYCTFGNGEFTRFFNERIFECFQCRFSTTTHKELYLHNRKMHPRPAILCFMCHINYFSFTEILCHICPGAANKTAVFDVKFRCCLCDTDNIPSPFRLMVHLRKKHFACDVCLEDCRDQSKLSSHVWKHKLHHVCYRCGISYRNKVDITKHLFWKHGTESIDCKRCLQKRWPHVYHFCVPPINFVCDVCNLCFSKATYLKVHKRIHTGDLRYPCTEELCEEKFISRRLLLKHTALHQQPMLPLTAELEPKEEDPKSPGTVKPEPMDVKNESAEQGHEENSFKAETLEDVKKSESKEEEDSKAVALGEVKASGTSTKKRKKSKRSKESLEDLNLTAPNLSESGSSDESDADSKYNKGNEDGYVPRVQLSPPSEGDNDKLDDTNDNADPSKVLEIWKNFLKSQQTGELLEAEPVVTEADYTEENYPQPNRLHVAYSDHDYCILQRPKSPPPPSPPAPPVKCATPHTSPMKRKTSKSPRRASGRRPNGSSSSSSSSSSSESSCSCGSNCSCSTSDSGSSSSSSSSDSDSSAGSKNSVKRHRKKSDRDRSNKRNESVSPTKKHNISENIPVEDEDVDVGESSAPLSNDGALRSPSPSKEPLFYESDLDTAESESDDDFYDEHPQKLASELLALKRAQLMARTRLSPSHNFDIVENSRPSTPSLPEEAGFGKKVKLKKKKRERKSSNKVNSNDRYHIGKAPPLSGDGVTESHHPRDPTVIPIQQQQHSAYTSSGADLVPPYDLIQSSPGMAEPPVAQQPSMHTHYSTQQLSAGDQRAMTHSFPGRFSDGSSCSDVDGSLKRSKRTRRPNKFYGYTSDDEATGSGLGQPLMIGMRAFKPQPPPQLTWRKEDLPTPSKSIMNPKVKTPRTSRTGLNTSTGGSSSSSKKKAHGSSESGGKPARKRSTKKSHEKLPPIPTLKIRPSQIGIGNNTANHIPTQHHHQHHHHQRQQIYSSSKDSDDEDDDTSSEEDIPAQLHTAPNLWNTTLKTSAPPPRKSASVFQAAQVLPPIPPPPTPQTTVFNHKIPPALLPNPDFATLQYFKANNIRYPIRPPAGARQAREGESVYCYCRCPYDEVSEMIACDGDNCLIEWFHFECVGIMVAPLGKWFCAECRPKYSEELYPTGPT